MKNKLEKYEIWGFVLTTIIGSLLHFAYLWSGENAFVATFSPVNESVWEHLKLLFFPYMVYAIFELIRFTDDWRGIILSKTLGVLAGMLSILMLFYTYSGIIGHHIVWIDIVIFIVSVGIAFWVSNKSFKMFKAPSNLVVIIAIFTIMLITRLFVSYTFAPPKLPLFLDTESMTYGIK
ncbi:MAG: DUF6512 family protein [Oscillospiraceae bacterium]